MIKTAPAHHSHLFRMKKSSVIQIVALSVAILVLVPQFENFQNSWQYLTSAQLSWLVLGIVGMVLTMVFATWVYMILVPNGLPFHRTLRIQLATYFTNRLLPSGLGGIGFNAMYLVKQTGMSRTDSAVFATANNIIGFVAFLLCVGVATLATDSNISVSLPLQTILIVGTCIVLVMLVVALFFKRVQKKLFDFVGHLFGVLLTILKHPRRMLLAVCVSTGITISYASVLWATTKSVGIDLSIVDIFIAFVAGNAALTVSPTPGGLGAVEVAITGVIISAGVSPSLALASVVLFRIISYWLPILPGYVAFRTALKRGYV